MNKATTLEELYEIAHTLDEENPSTIQSYHRIADRIRTETIGNNKRARPDTLAQAAPTGHSNATASTSTSLTTSSTPAATFLSHSLVYDVDEENYAQEAALVAGAVLDEDDQPAQKPINAIAQDPDPLALPQDPMPAPAPALDTPDLPDLRIRQL